MVETTGWSEIILDAAGVLIDDIRWTKDAANVPARFFSAKSDFVRAALPRLNRPPNLLTYLEAHMTEPIYDEYVWISTEESKTGPTQVDTSKIGYQLCTVALRAANGHSETAYPEASYDSETGIVTFPEQPSEGLEYTCDFYTDGTFPKLTISQEQLFALAVAVVWDQRMDRTWLSLTPKIKDSSFETVNEGNYAEKISQRLQRNEFALSDKLRKYEQDCAYATRVPAQRYFRTNWG